MTPAGRAWVRKAEEDRRALRALRAARPAVHALICFHCQQMAEKYLKTVVHERGHAVPKTHDCEVLVLLLGPTDPSLGPFRQAAADLTQYGVGPRYPFPAVTPNASRSRAAWSAAERIRAECRRLLGLRPLP